MSEDIRSDSLNAHVKGKGKYLAKTNHRKQFEKEINIVEKTFEIACDLLRFDVAPSPLLFTEDSMMTHPNKSNLLKELKVYLNPEDYC